VRLGDTAARIANGKGQHGRERRPGSALLASPVVQTEQPVQTEQAVWWARPGLEVRDGRLLVAGRDAEHLAREHGTPVYVHDLTSPVEQAEALRDAMAGAGLDHRIRLALKAQRDPAMLQALRMRAPFVGMDVCSPGEVDHALAHGWRPDEISYTGTNVSDRDFTHIIGAGVHINVDLLSQLDRYGRAAPGSAVGIRVNPGVGADYTGATETKYAGSKPTKFGILPERLDEAVAIAQRHDLSIDTVHYHSGYLYMSESIPAIEEAGRRVATMIQHLRGAGHPVTEVNTGGGLGVRFRPGDSGLDLDAWAQALARAYGGLDDLIVATEPGEYLAKFTATLLAEVVSVEDRGQGVTFVGLDAGWSGVNEHFVYAIPYHPVLARAADAEPARRYTVAGHINEGDDLFAEDWPMPEVREGDIVAVPNVGSYNLSMASFHCLRPPIGVVSFDQRI
jgi:diaminopimelate decarboxylase